MIELHFSTTEIEIIQRAFSIACDSGKMPDAAIVGDDTRVACLRQNLEDALKRHKRENTWGGRMGPG
jgi:hypothetical protein